MQGGMDFPDDITTNVFRVGDIKEVHWALYSVRRKEKSALQNPPSNEEEDLLHHLRLSEYILREDRRHVLFDKDKGGVWVFSVSQVLDEDVARTLSLDRFESISVGTIRSEELVSAISSSVSAAPSIKAARSAQSTTKTAEEANTQAYGSNNSSSIQPSISEPSNKGGEASNASNDYSVSEVYSKFMSAISYSLSHHLGKAREWIQVGPYACIDVRTLEDDLFDNLELHSWIATTTTLTFDIKWLSSGTILISFFQVRLPRYTRMSKLLSRDGKSTRLALGSPLLLSPSGIICQYLGQESILKSDVQRKTTAQAKASISSLLAHQGIRPMQEVKWIQVQMGRESNVCGGPSVSLWPADLCFCEDPMTPVSGENGESFNLSAVDGRIDPLEEAESWFLGKPARIQAARARAQEEDQKAQALKDIEDTDDEDLLSPLDVPMDQGITPQDVSGIYPTPPDGLPSALLGSSNPNNLQSGDYDDEEKEQQPSDEARGDYDGQENEDLFGDIDIDMFASNGLTEADFSFFDEPGMIDEDLRETGQVMALDDMNETTDHPMDFDGPKMTMTPHGKDDGELDRKFADNQEDVIGVHGTDKTLITIEDSLPKKDYEKGLESAVDKDDVDYAALEQLNLHRLATLQDEDADQRGSFKHVPFQRSTFNIDDKYNMQGRFAFDVDELPIIKHGDCPTENHLSRFLEESPVDGSVNLEDEGEDTPTPEDTDFHDATDLPHGSQAEPSRKRKREQLDEHDHLVTPSSSIPLAESPAGSPQNKVDKPVSDLSKLNVLEEAKDMVDLEARFRESSGPSFTGRGQIFIQVAQVVASQAVSGLLQSQTNVSGESNLAVQSIPDQSLQNTMTSLLSAFFPTNKRCSLKEYASLGEKSPANVSREPVASNQRSLKTTHISGGLSGTGHLIFKLDSPYTRVRRNGISTEIAASALSFWEELSLGPSYETKDIDAFCLCPKNRFIEEGVMAFLNMIKGAYQSCNLGSHDLGTSLADHSKRLFTAPMDAMKPDKFLEDIATTCEGLGTKLEELDLQSGTTVIYIINPFKNQQYLPGLCDALSRLPNSYGAALEKRRPERQNNIVMQIVPLDLVWSPESIVVPSPADYRRLAFEIYNQCGSSENGHTRESNFMRTPAIRLAKPVPKTIDFKLLSESSAPLMQSDNCVHVSYAWDATSEWLAAVWTDNLGVLSWRACYCLGKSELYPWKPFYEVAKEILETSFEMLHPRNGPWQLFICKDSPIFKLETDVWLRALADSSRPSMSLTILTIDAQPHLTFTHLDLHKSSSDVAPGLLATPGATPQTNIPSPDISVLGSTPAGNVAQVGTPPPNAVLSDHDSEARLIDITDETWGIVMDGTLDDLTTLSEKCICLASGYLVKRAGPRDEDGLIPLGVNLVHGQKPYRAALKEVLGMYRNLGTLARVRGDVDPVKSIVPLHVAAARKAWKVVSETMRYEPE